MRSYGRQFVSQSDIDAVVSVLQSDFLTQGPVVPRFEDAVADKCNARYAVAVNSATSALHIACLALGVGPGDMVWTTPNTFVASANCARYCGAEVDFVDIDLDTFAMSAVKLEAKLAKHKDAALPLPKVVIPVHFGGQPCDMSYIFRLGQEYGFQILEDASHAIGSQYDHQPVGNCRFSDITIFSFHPVKIITTGEGGMALTNKLSLKRKMVQLRSHGITRDPNEMFSEPDGPWYYEQLDLGFNYRMTDIHAALGLSQLGRLDDLVKRRGDLAKRYSDAFADLCLRVQKIDPQNTSAWHLYVICVDPESHHALFKLLESYGIGVSLHYLPVHLQPDYRRLGFKPDQFPVAENYASRAITLPLYPAMTNKEQDYIIATVSNNL